MAPIDPGQLLNALASLLSPEGGIKSVEEVARLSSLMKKFSKKLVSRCVYCNVLQATKPEILTVFLDENGWNTINIWLTDAKNSNNDAFLYELLKLCKVLPMTVDRLKQNNTARLVKSLSKFDNADVKELSNELVAKWMTIVKGETNTSSDSGSDRRKKKKADKVEKSVQEKDLKASIEKNVKEASKEPSKLTGLKRTSKDKETPEIYEDVKIDPEPLAKKTKIAVDRPKTVKLFNKKFRVTGLEEENPLPKPVPKKAAAGNRPAPVKTGAIKRANSSLSERVTDKKIKPESLLNNVENTNHSGGIKLIPAKARPAHILHESTSFMDALVAQPTLALKRKKKVSTSKPATPPIPPSPTIAAPKLQFYKETLEMDENEESSEKTTPDDDKTNKERPASPTDDKTNKDRIPSPTKENIDDTADISTERIESPPTPVDPMASSNEETIDDDVAKDVAKEEIKETGRNSEPGKFGLRSILTYGKRPEKKKSVRWVEDQNLKQVFLFEMDETERVNVNHVHENFGDLKTREVKREREAFEAARRHLGDKMEETISWWVEPIVIDLPPSLVVPGANSEEKATQHLKQESTLQEIYFTREMVPDSPHEPELEIFTQLEPKVIPLDDEFNLGTIMDYSNAEMPAPKPALPDVLASLINMPNNSQQHPNQFIPSQSPTENMITQIHPPISMGNPYEPGDPIAPMQTGLLGFAPPSHMFSSPPGPEMENVPMPNEWRQLEPMGLMAPPPEQFFNDFPPGGNRPMVDHMHQSMHNNRGDMRPRMNGPPLMPEIFHPSMNKGPNMPRPNGPSRNRQRITPCRHFMLGGCRFGPGCNFLHPGINGPRF